MRSRLLAAALIPLALCVLTACGDDPASSSQRTVATPSAASSLPPLTSMALTGGLLTVEDFPAGWSDVSSERDESALPTSDDATCQARLDRLVFNGEQPQGQAWGTFASDDQDAALEMSIDYYDDVEPPPVAANVREVLATCPQLVTTEDGERVEARVSALELIDVDPLPGGDSAAVRMNVTSDAGLSATIDLVAAVVGPNVVLISSYGTQPMSTDEFSSYVRTGMARFAAAAAASA